MRAGSAAGDNRAGALLIVTEEGHIAINLE
jgi:hypothetical protein